MKLIIVTGLSGSGKSVALHTLEDVGYYCIDNLPVFMLPSLACELASRGNDRYSQTAVGIDARNPSEELQSILPLLGPLKSQGIDYQILFLEAESDTLITRFSETRRKHPLSDETGSLADAIEREQKIMAPFQTAADLRIDTTRTNVHQLRDIIRTRIGHDQTSSISLLFLSFGFKHGIPKDADFVYDTRCLPNPHWSPALRPLTGQDLAVQDFLSSHEQVNKMADGIINFLEEWIPSFAADGRSYLTIAIGCTGGQHRSVYLTERLAKHFENSELSVQLRHRELSR
ncbi:MAG: RNase adapter RapZ [Chromatiales bacterium]|nr:RNase adapter RapZ [Chromatiales bacterium]